MKATGKRAASIWSVDHENETARTFNINAMPTVVVFTPSNYDKEFDREVGYLTASELLDWLKGIEAGKTADCAIDNQKADLTGTEH